jgi:hypothetical protein
VCLATWLPGDVYFGKTTARLASRAYHRLELAEEVQFVDLSVSDAMKAVLLQPDDPCGAEKLR